MSEKIISIMNIEELGETMSLVKEVFDEFEAPFYTKEGIENFYKFANYENIKEKLNKSIQIFVAKDNNKIFGMIAIRDYSHIALLFVKKEYHKQGTATKLMYTAIEYCKQNNSSLKNITVNSSPYAVEFYHKKGFKDIDKEQTVNGIISTPMRLKIN